VHTAMLPQILAYKFMTEYDYAAHIRSIRAIYRRKSDLMMNKLQEHLGESITFTQPDGGLFLWCDLPARVPMLDYAKTAAAEGVAVVPGTAFLVDENEPCNAIRLNFSTPSDEQIVKGIEILGQVLKKFD
ncbi:GntR family transcriptional regulator, partial [Escherichia coli]|nr:GntR family transcriptional regulator [Escherichia coli]